MSSTKEIEDSLPLTAPKRSPCPTQRTNLLLYIAASLTANEHERLLSTLHDYEYSSERTRLAPGDYQTKSVREIYDHHVRAREDDGSIHPFLFIVADRPDFTKDGVLIVNLAVQTDRVEPNRVVGVTRCSVGGDEGAESICVNLDTANCEWADVKYAEMRNWGGEDPRRNRRYFPTDSQTAESNNASSDDSTVFAWYSLVRKGKILHSAMF